MREGVRNLFAGQGGFVQGMDELDSEARAAKQ